MRPHWQPGDLENVKTGEVVPWRDAYARASQAAIARAEGLVRAGAERDLVAEALKIVLDERESMLTKKFALNGGIGGAMNVIESGEAREEGRVTPITLAQGAVDVRPRMVGVTGDYRLALDERRGVTVFEAIRSGAIFVAHHASGLLYASVNPGSRKLRRRELHDVHVRDRAWLKEALRVHVGPGWAAKHRAGGAGPVVQGDALAPALLGEGEEDMAEKKPAGLPVPVVQQHGSNPFKIKESAQVLKITERTRWLTLSAWDVAEGVRNMGGAIPPAADVKVEIVDGLVKLTWVEREEQLS